MKISTNSQKFLGVIALLLFTTQVAWGYSASGSAVKQVGSTYYVLYETGESNFSTISSKEYTLQGPGAQLTYDAKCVPILGFYGGDLKVAQKLDGNWSNKLFGAQPPKKSYQSYGPVGINRNATHIKLYTETGATGEKYFKNVFVTMAQYVDAPSVTSLAFGSAELGTSDVSKTFTVAWCNVSAMTWEVTGSGADQIEVSVSNNSEAGKYNTATFTVKYKHTKAVDLSATLTVKNTYGSYSKNISLTGSTYKHDQTLSWVNEASILPNMFIGGHQAIMAVGSPSGLNASSFSSNHSEILSVSDAGVLTAVAEGEATITAYQAGSDDYNAATPITYDFVVKPKATPTINPVGFSEGTTELKVDDVRTINLADVSAGLDGDFKVTASTADVMGITREGNTITLTALHAGTTTLTVKQTENSTIYGAEKSYTFNVTRYTPEFSLSTTNLVLDETATLTLNHVDGVSIDFSNDNVDYDAGVITAKKAGTTTLTVTQPETNSIEAREEVYTITVVKKTPTLTVKASSPYPVSDPPRSIAACSAEMRSSASA